MTFQNSQNLPFSNSIEKLSYPTTQNSSEGKINVNMPKYALK